MVHREKGAGCSLTDSLNDPRRIFYAYITSAGK